jgi:hypothetical protein
MKIVITDNPPKKHKNNLLPPATSLGLKLDVYGTTLGVMISRSPDGPPLYVYTLTDPKKPAEPAG